jgi:integrase
VPADRAKNGVAHIVPLNQLSMAELDRLAGVPEGEEQPKWPKDGLVLSTTGKTPISGITKAKTALDAAIAKAREGKPLPHWRIHDLRRTMATGFQKLGVRFEVTEAVLNHVSGARGGVAGVYQRHHWKDEKRGALDAWARRLEALLEPKTGDNVVSMDAAKRSA